MITEREIIYIAIAAVLLLYSVGLTVALAIVSKRIKHSAQELDMRISKTDDDIRETERKLDTDIQSVDKHIQDVEADTDRKIKDMGEELFAGATQLIEKKTSDVIGRMAEINTMLNIMDSTVKNLEREKLFVHGLLLDKADEKSIEADYTELPEGIAANAKRAISKAANRGKDIVKDYYPFIKSRAPGIARAAMRFVKSRYRRNGSEE